MSYKSAFNNYNIPRISDESKIKYPIDANHKLIRNFSQPRYKDIPSQLNKFPDFIELSKLSLRSTEDSSQSILNLRSGYYFPPPRHLPLFPQFCPKTIISNDTSLLADDVSKVEVKKQKFLSNKTCRPLDEPKTCKFTVNNPYDLSSKKNNNQITQDNMLLFDKPKNINTSFIHRKCGRLSIQTKKEMSETEALRGKMRSDNINAKVKILFFNFIVSFFNLIIKNFIITKYDIFDKKEIKRSNSDLGNNKTNSNENSSDHSKSQTLKKEGPINDGSTSAINSFSCGLLNSGNEDLNISKIKSSEKRNKYQYFKKINCDFKKKIPPNELKKLLIKDILVQKQDSRNSKLTDGENLNEIIYNRIKDIEEIKELLNMDFVTFFKEIYFGYTKETFPVEKFGFSFKNSQIMFLNEYIEKENALYKQRILDVINVNYLS